MCAAVFAAAQLVVLIDSLEQPSTMNRAVCVRRVCWQKKRSCSRGFFSKSSIHTSSPTLRSTPYGSEWINLEQVAGLPGPDKFSHLHAAVRR